MRNLLVLAAAVVLAPAAWSSGDLPLRAAYALACGIAIAVVVRRRRRPETRSEAYARALRDSSALHVRLRHARVAAMHTSDQGTMITVTWRAASTTLLDADGRTRATPPRPRSMRRRSQPGGSVPTNPGTRMPCTEWSSSVTASSVSVGSRRASPVRWGIDGDACAA